MLLQKFFLQQLEREANASRKVIERVPEGQNTWKPHERSMELGLLAALVATIPGWLALMIERDELDLNDPSNSGFRTKPLDTRAELLRALESGLDRSRQALKAATEAHMMGCWRLTMSNQVVTEGPRYAMIADGALSHLAHHRGQLTVYLRLNGGRVPAIYGPSADETH